MTNNTYAITLTAARDILAYCDNAAGHKAEYNTARDSLQSGTRSAILATITAMEQFGLQSVLDIKETFKEDNPEKAGKTRMMPIYTERYQSPISKAKKVFEFFRTHKTVRYETVSVCDDVTFQQVLQNEYSISGIDKAIREHEASVSDKRDAVSNDNAELIEVYLESKAVAAEHIGFTANELAETLPTAELVNIRELAAPIAAEHKAQLEQAEREKTLTFYISELKAAGYTVTKKKTK